MSYYFKIVISIISNVLNSAWYQEARNMCVTIIKKNMLRVDDLQQHQFITLIAFSQYAHWIVSCSNLGYDTWKWKLSFILSYGQSFQISLEQTSTTVAPLQLKLFSKQVRLHNTMIFMSFIKSHTFAEIMWGEND